MDRMEVQEIFLESIIRNLIDKIIDFTIFRNLIFFEKPNDIDRMELQKII